MSDANRGCIVDVYRDFLHEHGTLYVDTETYDAVWEYLRTAAAESVWTQEAGSYERMEETA